MKSEACRELHVESVVVAIGSGSIVRVGVVELEQIVFAQTVVGGESPIGFQSLPGAGVVAVAVPATIEFHAFATGDGHTGQHVPTIALVGAALGGAAVAVHIFAAGIPTTFILETEGVALALQTVGGIGGVGETAVPTKAADGKAIDRANPQTADEILEMVDVGVVDALAIEEADLIVQEFPTARKGKEVAHDLHTRVATVGGVFADAVVEALQFRGDLREAAETDGKRREGFVEAEGAVELTDAHLDFGVFARFDIGIEQTRTSVDSGSATHLELKPVEDIAPHIAAAVEAEVAHGEIAGGGGTLTIGDLKLGSEVASECDRGFESGKTFGRFCLHCADVCEAVGRCETGIRRFGRYGRG